MFPLKKKKKVSLYVAYVPFYLMGNPWKIAVTFLCFLLDLEKTDLDMDLATPRDPGPEIGERDGSGCLPCVCVLCLEEKNEYLKAREDDCGKHG